MFKIDQPDSFRSNFVKKIDLIIENEKISRNIERGIYNFTLKECTNRKLLKKWDNPFFVTIYIDRMKSIYTNLQYEPFKKLIQSGEIKMSELAYMTHQEMRPDKWEKMIEEKSKRDKCKYETEIEAATDRFIWLQFLDLAMICNCFNSLVPYPLFLCFESIIRSVMTIVFLLCVLWKK